MQRASRRRALKEGGARLLKAIGEQENLAPFGCLLHGGGRGGLGLAGLGWA